MAKLTYEKHLKKHPLVIGEVISETENKRCLYYTRHREGRVIAFYVQLVLRHMRDFLPKG